MSEEGQSVVLFLEEQRFRQFWVWLIVLGLAGLIWYSTVRQILLKRPFGSRPAPDAMLIIFWLLFGIGLPLLLLSAKLITEVRQDGIYLRFIPFHFSFQKIPFEEMKTFEVRTYNALREYGGWGIRYGPHGRAYNVGGSRGLQLEFQSGKKLLIGSQRAEELLMAVQAEHTRHQSRTI